MDREGDDIFDAHRAGSDKDDRPGGVAQQRFESIGKDFRIKPQ